MKKDAALAKVRMILDEHGVKDFGVFKSKGYLVGELDVFCEAAASILKKLPYGKWDQEEIARNAKEVYGHAKNYIKGESHIVVRIMGNLYFTWCNYKKKIYRPSILQKDVVTERAYLSRDQVSNRIEEVVAYVSNIFQKHSGFRSDKTQISNPWNNITRFKFFLDDGYNFCMIINHHDLLHDSIDRICSYAHDYHSKYTIALSRYPALNHEKIKSTIDGLNKKYDLYKYPFSICYNSGINLYGLNNERQIGIYINGYTDSGLFEDIYVNVIYEHSLGTLEGIMERVIKSQISLHNKFGAPKTYWSEIKIDLVTYKYLKTIPHGIENLEYYMKTGQNSPAQTGVKFKQTKKGLMGVFKIGENVEWRGDKIYLYKIQLAQAVISSLKGRNICDLVGHEIIGSHAVMGSCKTKTTKTGSRIEVSLRPEMTVHRLESF